MCQILAKKSQVATQFGIHFLPISSERIQSVNPSADRM